MAGAFIKTTLMVGAAIFGTGLTPNATWAGGFLAHEQSAYFQGLSFAGAAAGGPSPSAMFWNPGVITQYGRGLTSESNYTAFFGRSLIDPILATSGSGANLLPFGGSGDLAKDAFLAASYVVYGLNEWVAFGLALNSPFGLTTRPYPGWAGMFYSREFSVFTVNVNPNLAFRLGDWISVGVGLQVEYFKARLDSAFPGSGTLVPLSPLTLQLRGDSIDVGFTAGITISPTPWTVIGLGYRSRIDHSIEGEVSRPAFAADSLSFPPQVAALKASVPLPDVATLSIRQSVTEHLTLLGTVEWTNWSRLGVVTGTASPPVAGLPNPILLPFEWRDGWLYSAGIEYRWSPQLALRAGFGWETSPITDRTRGTQLPDADRFWVSIGCGYNISERLSLEFSYSHVFVDDAPINISATSGNPLFNPGLGAFVGKADSQVDIVSVALRYRWGDIFRPRHDQELKK
jgi:long-chain fatty acid transport protein